MKKAKVFKSIDFKTVNLLDCLTIPQIFVFHFNICGTFKKELISFWLIYLCLIKFDRCHFVLNNIFKPIFVIQRQKKE